MFKLVNEEGLWQQILRRKYLANKTLGQVSQKPGDSHFWSGLMKVKNTFLAFGVFKVNDGCGVRFWEDKWLGDFTLQHRFPCLYNIVQRKNATVANVFRSVLLNVSFWRGLYGQNLVRWHMLVSLVADTTLNHDRDGFRWNLHQNGLFSTKSMYEALIGFGQVRQNDLVWKLKLPLKIKIFSWFLRRGLL